MQYELLEPKKVFHFFKEIAGIPHGSGNTRQLEDYCLAFAQERGLESYRDDYGNVMIFKPASCGYEDHEPVILQGHLDMVCEHAEGKQIDMKTQPITVQNDANRMWADGTTLGADDGIAIAFALAILDSENVLHPPIEALFTVDEEVGLLGANNLDVSKLKGRKLINIDSEEEGILTVSCAGAARVTCRVPITENAPGECAITVTVSGLLGGHSGFNIGAGRRNAVKVLGEALDHVYQVAPFTIAEIHSGGTLNVIPQTATAVIHANGKDCAAILLALQEFDAIMKKDCRIKDPGIAITAMPKDAVLVSTDEAGTRKLITALMLLPQGVATMSPTLKDLVQTSLNLGALDYAAGELVFKYMIRSNTDHGKHQLKRQVARLVEYMEGTMVVESEYNAWEERQESPLREVMEEVYADLYGEKPAISAMHAGLECGIIAEKLGDVDAVSFGPTMRNVHTPMEELDIHSVERTFKYLLHLLQKL